MSHHLNYTVGLIVAAGGTAGYVKVAHCFAHH